MKTLIFLSFNAGNRPLPILRKWFEVAGCHALAHKKPSPIGYYTAKFAEDAPALHRLRALLADEGIDWAERREKIFTASELETFPLLWLCVKTAPKGMGGPTYGTEYDLSKACPQCGTEAIQTSPFFWHPPKFRSRGQSSRHSISGCLFRLNLQIPSAMQELEVGQVAKGWANALLGATLEPARVTAYGSPNEGNFA